MKILIGIFLVLFGVLFVWACSRVDALIRDALDWEDEPPVDDDADEDKPNLFV